MSLFDDTKASDKIGVYIIHNQQTDEVYVGSGVLKSRQASHEYHLKRGTHWNHKLQKAYDSNPNFEFIGLHVNEGDEKINREIALSLEQETINENLNNPHLLNLTLVIGKPMLGHKHSPETIEKNRQAALARWSDPEYKAKQTALLIEAKANLPEERKKEISDAQRLRMLDAYTSGDRVSTKGQKRTEEFKQETSLRIRDKWTDPIYRDSQTKGRVGKTVSVNKKTVEISGVLYESITAAGEALGLTKQGVSYRIGNPNFPEWKRLK